MKQLISILLVVVGILCIPAYILYLYASIAHPDFSPNLGIIGGADGPTAVFVARTASAAPGFLSVSLIGLVLIVTGILLLCKQRK